MGDPKAKSLLEWTENQFQYNIVNLWEDKDHQIEKFQNDNSGWGSNVRGIFDNNGKLKEMRRETTIQDTQAAASYLRYLEEEFQE